MRNRSLCRLLSLVTAATALTVAPAAAADTAGLRLILEYGGVVSMTPEGTDVRLLAEAGQEPAVSPDGTTVAFTHSETLFLVDRDGADERALAGGAGGPRITGPAWSPDGGQLAYVESPDGGLAGRIMVVDVADGVPRAVTAPPSGSADRRPVWSPAGDEIAFVRDAYTAQPSIRLTTPGGDERVLVDESAGDAVAWSPDGRELVYADGDVYAVPRDGGARRTIASGPGAQNPQWSPDGRSIAYTAGSGVYVAQADGDGAPRLVAESTLAAPTTATWSPDGQLLAIGMSVDDSGCHCIVWYFAVVAADGTGFTELPVMSSTSDADYTFRVLMPAWLPAEGAADPFDRLGGPTRVETAAEISRAAFETATAVVLARADAYPDALAGAPLAARAGAPLLLTPGDALHPAVAAEIDRLAPSSVILLGDESALGPRVADAVRARGVATVRRVAGANRYDTARLVSGELPRNGNAFLVEGAHADPARGWPDAVAVSALAAATRRPVLLVERDRLPPETARALRDGGIDRVTVVGGAASVAQTVVDEVAELGVSVTRVAGANRYATSAAVADAALAAGTSAATVWLATGSNWPDSLAAGPAAATAGALLLLTDGRLLDASPEAGAWLQAHRDSIQALTLLGSGDVLSPEVGRAAAQAAGIAAGGG